MNTCPVCKKDHNNKIFCSKNCRSTNEGQLILLEKRKQTFIKKYGCDNPFGNKDIKDKIKKANLEKYGVENPQQCKEIHERTKQTNIDKYGCDNPFANENVKNKIRKTNLEKYGIENINRCKSIRNKIIQTNLRKYGHEYGLQSKEIIEKKKRTNLEKYGHTCYLHSSEGFEKTLETWERHYATHPLKSEIIKEKIRQTNLEKYGCENPFSSEIIKEKIRQTNLEKYGCKYGLLSNIIKDQIKQTNLLRYGCENPFGNNMIKEKIKNSMYEKYGVVHPLQSPEIKIKFLKTHYRKILKNLDFTPLFSEDDYAFKKQRDAKWKWRCTKCSTQFFDYVMPKCKKCNPHILSIPEKNLQDWLEQYIPIERNKRYFENGKYKYELDIFIPSKNIGIEFNGLYHHSEIAGGKSPTYHLQKSEYFLDKSIEIIHIFENEWFEKQEIIKSLILEKLNLITIDKHTDLKELTNQEFFNFQEKNFIYEFTPDKIIGLFRNKELIACLSSRNDELFYIHKNFKDIENGFETAFPLFSISNPKILVDRRFLNYEKYIKNGFGISEITSPKCFFFDHKRILLNHVDNSCNYDRIWDCGNLIFEFTS